nr:GNAT family N-acetyltransferase [uncultured Lichenicoccus sp.]
MATLDRVAPATRRTISAVGAERPTARFVVKALSTQQARTAIRSCWNQLLSSNDRPGALYQSDNYYDYRCETGDIDGDVLAVSGTAQGSIVGVVPLKATGIGLQFIARSAVFLRLAPQGLFLLGSEPMLVEDTDAFDGLFLHLLQHYPRAQAVSMMSVVVDSFTWRYVTTSKLITENYYLYMPEGPRNCHSITVPISLDAYQHGLSKKRRYNLHRQERLLQEHLAEEISLIAVDRVSRLPELYAAIDELRATDPAILSREQYELTCKHGILLCYVLRTPSRIIGLAIGSKSRRTFLVHKIFHDDSLNKFSPGTALWQYILRDLIERAEFTRVDMGFGDPAYRQHTTNVIEQRARILLFRRTLANRLRIAAHRGYYAGTADLKRRLRDNPLGALLRRHVLEPGPIQQRLVSALRLVRSISPPRPHTNDTVFR